MAEIEDMGLEEFYSHFVRISGKRGTVLLFYEDDEQPPLQLAAELGAVLDGQAAEALEGIL